MCEELKPCPFCGGEDVEHLLDGFGNWLVGCVTCDYRIQCVDCTEDDAIRYWNTRPAEDALKAEVERLKADNERLKKALKKIDDLTFMPRNKDEVLDRTWHITRAALCTDTDAPNMNVAAKESEGEE